jgi:hypothetical protein
MATGAAIRMLIRRKRFPGRGAPLLEARDLEVPPSRHRVVFGPSGAVARILAACRPTRPVGTQDPVDAARLAHRVTRVEGAPARIVEAPLPTVSPADVAALGARLVGEDASGHAPTGLGVAR